MDKRITDEKQIDTKIIKQIPREILKTNNLIPVKRNSEDIVFLSSEYPSFNIVNDLEVYFNPELFIEII